MEPAAKLSAQMVSPSIDRPGQPFSYYSKPTDEIGVMDAEAATEITPEGYLRTGFGELMFFAGPELEPTSVRLRTLEDGRLPVIHYSFERGGVEYTFTLLAATKEIQNGRAERYAGQLHSHHDEECGRPDHARHSGHGHSLRRAQQHRRTSRRQSF